MEELTKEEITSLADALQHGVLAVQRKQAARMLGVSLSIFDRLDIPFIYYLDRLSLKRWRVSDLKAFVDEQAVGRRRDVKACPVETAGHRKRIVDILPTAESTRDSPAD